MDFYHSLEMRSGLCVGLFVVFFPKEFVLCGSADLGLLPSFRLLKEHVYSVLFGIPSQPVTAAGIVLLPTWPTGQLLSHINKGETNLLTLFFFCFQHSLYNFNVVWAFDIGSTLYLTKSCAGFLIIYERIMISFLCMLAFLCGAFHTCLQACKEDGRHCVTGSWVIPHEFWVQNSFHTLYWLGHYLTTDFREKSVLRTCF